MFNLKFCRVYRLFKLKPELISVFPEFGYLENIEEIKKMPRLAGHPKKIIQAIREAIKSLDDAENFVNKLEALGQKHVENSLRPDYLHVCSYFLTPIFHPFSTIPGSLQKRQLPAKLAVYFLRCTRFGWYKELLNGRYS